MDFEEIRLSEERDAGIPWKKWGPYLSERQWGTVREDYSDDGNAWNYFSHDQARSRSYRWGEDGLGGISDNHQVLCFSVALWNKNDPILKERLFGLTNAEGNHGEDVKEYYFYVDSTPTHSYMKYQYKYPQRAYPYDELVRENGRRSKFEAEYELMDTGVFDDDRYFDVVVEYAKQSPEDILIKITAFNRGADVAALDLLPTLWFRNTWSWSDPGVKPMIEKVTGGSCPVACAYHTDHLFLESLSRYYLYCEGSPQLLFTENETNNARLFNSPNLSPYVKDGINNFVVHKDKEAINPQQTGTKLAVHHDLSIEPGESVVVRLRLTTTSPTALKEPFSRFDALVSERLTECDQFYGALLPAKVDKDRALIFRRAIAGMLWSKQYFYYDVDKWLSEHKKIPGALSRNHSWYHMYSDDIISMPDKWEYPWFAAWDLAFHMIPLSLVDAGFAKEQLMMMLLSNYMHPNGQIPAYEWNFSDVNPPVHAWATMQSYLFDKFSNNGVGDIRFLRFAFSKLLMNFSWWVNRKDPRDSNVFAGGFLGLDNIGVFDRSSPLPTGGFLEQADGTAWMAFYCQQMLRLSVELALEDPLYEEFAIKFFEHAMWISGSMDRIGDNADELWDEEDGFFYDVLRFPDGGCFRMKLRSMVGLLPITASSIFPADVFEKLPRFQKRIQEFVKRHPDVAANMHLPTKTGVIGRRMFSACNEKKLRRILTRMLDENEFLSPYGIRSLSRYHLEHPYEIHYGGQHFSVKYLPGESDSGLFGGNSNWRGPVWMPVNFLLLRELLSLFAYYGESFKIEFPTGSGQERDLFDIAIDLANRMINMFVKDDTGRRPANGAVDRFKDPHWDELVLFYEYFHGDNGTGLGASHQTGWTGLVARLIHLTATLDKATLLSPDAHRAYMKVK